MVPFSKSNQFPKIAMIVELTILLFTSMSSQ
jgi:hypothetical protein